jgi:hypothetical protein
MYLLLMLKIMEALEHSLLQFLITMQFLLLLTEFPIGRSFQATLNHQEAGTLMFLSMMLLGQS